MHIAVIQHVYPSSNMLGDDPVETREIIGGMVQQPGEALDVFERRVERRRVELAAMTVHEYYQGNIPGWALAGARMYEGTLETTIVQEI